MRSRTTVFSSGSGDFGSYIDYVGGGRFNVKAGGAQVGMFDALDVYDLVMFFKEAFNDSGFVQEVAKRERGIVTGLKKRQNFIPRGFRYGFSEFVSEQAEEYARENGYSDWDYQSNDTDSTIFEYLRKDRRAFAQAVHSQGLMNAIQAWLKKYADYPLVGYISEDVNVLEGIKFNK